MRTNKTTKQIAQAAESLLKSRNDYKDLTELNYIVKAGDKPKVGYYSNYDEQLAHLDDRLIFLRNCNSLEDTVVIQRSYHNIELLKKFVSLLKNRTV